jgi:hypothetical protein
MGCDIHILFEKQLANGKWIPEEKKFEEYRSYDIFALICGVRVYWQCKSIIPRDRGLPINCHKYTQDHLDSIEYHSHGYITGKEITEYPYWNEKFVDTRDNNALKTPMEMLNDHNPWNEIFEWLKTHPNIRMVFAFDC